MNVLSLFDGMSGGQIALKEIGVTPDIYYASEIDKHAIAQTQLNFPNTIQLGSVVDVDVSKLDRIDLLLGGSPCQSFSFAGKRKGMATKCDIEIYTLEKYLQLKSDGFEFEGQSYLFWEYMRILTDIRKYNPDVKFLLENVEMGSKWERILSEAIGIFGVHINSALVSAQNRKRIYWTNIRTREEGLFGELYSDVHQPEDRGILLRDILENDVDEKYYVNNIANNKRLNKTISEHNIGAGDLIDSYNNTIHRNKSITISTRVSASNCTHVCEKTNCLTSVQKDNLVMQLNPSKESGGKQPYQQNGIYDPDGIMPALMTEYRGNIVVPCDYRHDEGLRLKHDGKTGTLLGRARNDESCGQLVLENIICHNTMPRSSKTGKGETGHLSRNDGKTYCLDTGQTNAVEIQQSRIRRLTPRECARLQTIPEWYRWQCSDTQQYRMLGNGWTIEVISWILSFLNN